MGRYLLPGVVGSLLIAALSGLTGCGSTAGGKVDKPALLEDPELTQISAVSVARPGFELEPGASIAWRTELLWLGGEGIEGDSPAVAQMNIRREIERQLSERGHSWVESTDADYLMVAAVVVGDSEAGAALEELGRLYPSLSYIPRTLETGTLLVAMSRPGSPVVLWRSALQTAITHDHSQAAREARLRAVVRSLLNTLPDADR